MQELEFTVIQLQKEFVQLQGGMETSATGRLSSVLIPPHNLSKFLQEVALWLPPDASLLAGSSMENMYLYYDVATVQAYAKTSAIRLVVRIPLRGADRVMTLFRSSPLPTYSKILQTCANRTRDSLYCGHRERTMLLTFDDGGFASM